MWSEGEVYDEDEERKMESEIDSEMEGMLYAQIHYELPHEVWDNCTDQLSDVQNSSSIRRNWNGIDTENSVKLTKNDSPEKTSAKKRTKTERIKGKKKLKKGNSDVTKRESELTIGKQNHDSAFVTVSFDHGKETELQKRTLNKKKKKVKPLPTIIELSSSDNDDVANAATTMNLPLDIRLNLQNGQTKQSFEEIYNSEIEDFDLETVKDRMNDDNWKILDIDRYYAANKKNRYFKNKEKRCHICQVIGHTAYNCPKPVKPVMCIYCGRPNHMFNECPDMMCVRCWNSGHSSNFCWIRQTELKKSCTLCKFRGHSEYQCPDYWRRYHLTTTSGPPVMAKDPYKFAKKVYCYNCGRQGHFGFVCGEPRMQSSAFPTCPFIVRYEEPYFTPRRNYQRNEIFLPENMNVNASKRLAECSLAWRANQNRRKGWNKQPWHQLRMCNKERFKMKASAVDCGISKKKPKRSKRNNSGSYNNKTKKVQQRERLIITDKKQKKKKAKQKQGEEGPKFKRKKGKNVNNNNNNNGFTSKRKKGKNVNNNNNNNGFTSKRKKGKNINNNNMKNCCKIIVRIA